MPRQKRNAPPISVATSDSPSCEEAGGPSPSGARVGSCPWAGVVPDVLLARSAARGDDTACGELVRRYRDRIYMVAYGWVQNRDEALDITQETLLQMLQSLPRFREQANFSTWLHRIALNRCIDWGRRKARRPPLVSLNDLIETGWAEPADGRSASRPDQALMTKELRGQVHAAIAAIPEVFRRVVVLADLEGLSTREIAVRLSCPENTVKTRLHRGRSHVRQRLQAYLDSGS